MLSIAMSLFRPENLWLRRLSAASYFIGANTAGTGCGFAAVGAHTFAVVDKVSAVDATRLILLAHPLRLCPHNFVLP
jgi:hypothetical protein